MDKVMVLPKIEMPSKYLVFFSMPPKKIRNELVKAYIKVFSGSPWFEHWSNKEVLDKIEKDIKSNGSFIVVMLGNRNIPVAGFSWGSIIRATNLPERVAYALKISPPKEIANKLNDAEIIYFDEFAVLEEFRREGLEPVRFLLLPGLELGYQNNIYQTLFWSTPDSKIVPIAQYFGFEKIYDINVNEKKIVFLFNKDSLPLLRMARRWMKIPSK